MKKTLQIAAIFAIGAIAYAIGYQQGRIKTPASEPATADNTVPIVPDTPEPASTPAQPESLPKTNHTPIAETKPEKADPQTQGYDAAAQSLENAFLAAQEMKGRKQMQFVRGLFTYLATHASPAEALELAATQTGSINRTGLRTLAAAWALENQTLSQDEATRAKSRIFSLSGNQLGLEVELASLLARSNVSPEITDAWKNAFAQHPGRSEIQARLVAGKSPAEIQAALNETQNWTAWERENFSESLIFQWAQQSPQQAWDWYSQNGDKLAQDRAAQLIETWAAHEPDQLKDAFKTFENPADRLKAIESISSSLARRGTQEALQWAESLSNPQEQNAAYQAVYQATPKGIGAQVGMKDGFPQIRQIIPGGALESTDVQAGDLIVEARDQSGATHNLYGKQLRETIGSLRGEPGSSVEIRYLRQNPATGQLEERTTTVVRDLLILDTQENDNP